MRVKKVRYYLTRAAFLAVGSLGGKIFGVGGTVHILTEEASISRNSTRKMMAHKAVTVVGGNDDEGVLVFADVLEVLENCRWKLLINFNIRLTLDGCFNRIVKFQKLSESAIVIQNMHHLMAGDPSELHMGFAFKTNLVDACRLGPEIEIRRCTDNMNAPPYIMNQPLSLTLERS